MKALFRIFSNKLLSCVRYIDKTLLFLCVLTTTYGILLIYSATYSYSTLHYVNTQIFATVGGVIVYFIASKIDIDRFAKHWKLLFIINLLLIGSLYFFADKSQNNTNWIYIDQLGLSFQPAEIGKLIFILSFAGHLDSCKDNVSSKKNVFHLVLHVAFAVGFVILFSKDDGMTLAYLFIAIVMAFVSGIKYRWFLVGGVSAAAVFPLIWKYILDDYQRLRILVVFDPSIDAAKAYQAKQSVTALGTGMLTGRGFLQGHRTQSGLIPTKHTDSIFAVAGEEFGLIGTFSIILLLSFIVLRCFSASLRHTDSPSGLIAAGLGTMIMFQTFLNIGMNMGIFPIIGLTLPFLSYGGTSLITMYLAMGIVSGIVARERLK